MSRTLSPSTQDQDKTLDLTLRPTKLDQFIGQKHLKEKMTIFLSAARKRGEPLDHTLFHGPPGLGKTTLAHVISHEMNTAITSTAGPAIEKRGDLAAILTNLPEGSVLFIDEIHRLNHVIEEILYPAMEDYQLDIIIGEGPSARTIKIDLPKFTLVGATTRAGLLTSPLRDRFGIVERINYYPPEDLVKIVTRSGKILGIELSHEGACEVARRSRGTPRIANRLLRRVRDFADIKADGKITKDLAKEALTFLEVDEAGFDEMDRAILRTIIEKFGGGPVGIDTLSAALSEAGQSLEDIYEPFLIQNGYIMRTPRGRVATELAYTHLGIEYKDRNRRNGSVTQESLL